ncbi:MAG TPA: hypothetical protein VK760_14840 [Candidatus Acidoferrales bacterium]|jgi:hypothetical protein|nr:hypothetical protein [Candidatus Acidoferrales bacterium]
MSTYLARTILIVVTIVVAIVYYTPAGQVDFLENWGGGTYGIEMTQLGDPIVQGVISGSPADKAGVRVGDRLIHYRIGGAWARVNTPYVGEARTIEFERGGAVRSVVLTAVPVPGFGLAQRIGGVLALVPATVFLIVAFMLVFLRPSIMSWSFYLFAIGYFGTLPVLGYWSHFLPDAAARVLAFMLLVVFGSCSPLPLLPFILRFPNGDLRGWRHKVDKFVWIFIAASFALGVYEFSIIQSTDVKPVWDPLVATGIPLFTFLFAALIVVKNYSVATPADRQRYGFLIMGTIVSFAAYAVYYIPGVSFAVGQVVGFAVVLMPICVAYGVLRLRVMDVNFVLNRALVYGLLSVAVIAFISLLDWTFSRVVSLGRFTVGIELLATIAIGFLLDRINRLVERTVEAVFFRRRRDAEAYVRRAAAALPYATDEAAISEGLVQVPVSAMELAAGALYRRASNGSRFEGVATSAETLVAPGGFDANHLLVRMLLASEKRMWLDEVRAYLDPVNATVYVLAVPVMVRHELVSFTLYGAHRNGAQLDPEEVELLEELANEASRSYDHVEAVRVRARYGAVTAPTPETA